MFPDFPHPIDSEPTEDWTVEHVLQWCLLQSHVATDQKHEELVGALKRQFEEGKQELWNVLSEQQQQNENKAFFGGNGSVTVSSASSIKGTKMSSCLVDENKQQFPNNALAATARKKVDVIHVQVTAGPHAGKCFSLQPKPNAPCLVGRSAGKKFRDKGVSLSKDSEVSTTHGKFEIISGKAYFTDVGSTNGTMYKDHGMLATNEPLLLEDSVELILGGTTLRITIG